MNHIFFIQYKFSITKNSLNNNNKYMISNYVYYYVLINSSIFIIYHYIIILYETVFQCKKEFKLPITRSKLNLTLKVCKKMKILCSEGGFEYRIKLVQKYIDENIIVSYIYS